MRRAGSAIRRGTAQPIGGACCAVVAAFLMAMAACKSDGPTEEECELAWRMDAETFTHCTSWAGCPYLTCEAVEVFDGGLFAGCTMARGECAMTCLGGCPPGMFCGWEYDNWCATGGTGDACAVDETACPRP